MNLMNLNLNYEGFETYLVQRLEWLDGVEYQFRFENDYGAIVDKSFASYGHESDLWALQGRKLDKRTGMWGLIYHTEFPYYILGYKTDEEIRDLLKRIKEL